MKDTTLTTQTSNLTLERLISLYPPKKPKRCKITTSSGCMGSFTAWGQWMYPPGAWAQVMPPYRMPMAWQCDKCGHWSHDEGKLSDNVLQVTRDREVIWQSPDDQEEPPDLSSDGPY